MIYLFNEKLSRLVFFTLISLAGTSQITHAMMESDHDERLTVLSTRPTASEPESLKPDISHARALSFLRTLPVPPDSGPECWAQQIFTRCDPSLSEAIFSFLRSSEAEEWSIHKGISSMHRLALIQAFSSSGKENELADVSRPLESYGLQAIDPEDEEFLVNLRQVLEKQKEESEEEEEISEDNSCVEVIVLPPDSL